MIQDRPQPETTLDTRVYKPKLWVILLNLFNLVLLISFACMPIVSIITAIVTSNHSETNSEKIPLIFLCAFTPVLAMLGIVIIQLIVSFISIFFSYIKVSPEGIENRIWPYRHIRSRWSEIDRLGTFFIYDAIYLKSFEVIGLSLSYARPLKFLNFSRPSIVLSTYNGWPSGQLAGDLKHYAPELFDNSPAAREVQTPNADSNISGISQENRLLAALSHASVLFTGLGLFVPLVIYATQKKKSAYLAFHALQAFIFQLIGIIFSFIFPICLVGAMFITSMGTILPANGSSSDSSAVVLAMMVISVAIGMLLGLGGLLFVIYGIVGAIKAYQGKDFRYAIIGKRLEKRDRPE